MLALSGPRLTPSLMECLPVWEWRWLVTDKFLVLLSKTKRRSFSRRKWEVKNTRKNHIFISWLRDSAEKGKVFLVIAEDAQAVLAVITELLKFQ